MSFFPRDLPAPAPVAGLKIDWEEPDCLLCGSRHWHPVVEAPDHIPGGTGLWFAVVQCQDCGLCFTSPRPSTQTIGRFYPPQYRPHLTRPHRNGSRALAHRVRRLRLPGKEEGVVPPHGLGRFLDFGCGSGAFLERMYRQGWQVTGLDISASALDRAASSFPCRMLVGSLPHPDLKPGSFDFITMRHSLEHVHEPLEILRQAYRLLGPGGRLLVSVPNIDSLPFRWFGSAWVGLDLPRHLTHFAPATLERMVQQAGFQVGPLRMLRHGNWLRSSARLSCQRRRSPSWHRLFQTRPTSGLATWYSFLTHQADCLLVTAERGSDLY